MYLTMYIAEDSLLRTRGDDPSRVPYAYIRE